MEFVHLGQSTCREKVLLVIFYNSLYVDQFPDPDERESLKGMQGYLALREAGGYGENNYHIILGYEGEKVVAACVADYVRNDNAGIIEFIMVDPDTRGKGYGRQMFDYMEGVFHGDARKAGLPAAAYIAAEMNDPFATDPGSDNLDPFLRSRIWGSWGFGKIDFDYLQPSLGEGQKAVENLLFMAKDLANPGASTIPAATVRSIVYDYLKLAMHKDDPEVVPEFRKMSASLEGREHVGLKPLAVYAAGKRPSLKAVPELSSSAPGI